MGQCEAGEVGTCLVDHCEDFGFDSGLTGKDGRILSRDGDMVGPIY